MEARRTDAEKFNDNDVNNAADDSESLYDDEEVRGHALQNMLYALQR
jgi:hypothetical protein